MRRMDAISRFWAAVSGVNLGGDSASGTNCLHYVLHNLHGGRFVVALYLDAMSAKPPIEP